MRGVPRVGTFGSLTADGCPTMNQTAGQPRATSIRASTTLQRLTSPLILTDAFAYSARSGRSFRRDPTGGAAPAAEDRLFDLCEPDAPGSAGEILLPHHSSHDNSSRLSREGPGATPGEGSHGVVKFTATGFQG
jgi:hypothetical protein